MKKMRILIIAHYYPPLNGVAAGRPYSWANFWTNSGHDVHVLTTQKNINDGSLNYTPDHYIVPKRGIQEISYWPYKEKQQKFIKNNQDVLKNNKSVYRVFKKISNIRKSLLPLPTLKFQWIFPAFRYANNLYKSWPYEIVVSTFDPIASHVIASKIKAKRDVYWVADYRDLWTGRHLSSQSRIVFTFFKHMEKFFLKNADLITTVSDPIRKRLIDFHNKPTMTIENGFDPDEYRNITSSIFPKDDKIRIVYMGTVRPHKQDPSPLFEAIKRIKNGQRNDADRLKILFYGGRLESLQRLISQYDVSDIVSVVGFIDRKSSVRIQRDADALLFLEWNDPAVQGILTGKLFEYMFSGTPILSIGAAESNSADMIIKQSRTGIILNRSVDNIVHVLQKMLNGEQIEYSPEMAVVNKYHRKYLADKMLNEIQTHLKNKPAES